MSKKNIEEKKFYQTESLPLVQPEYYFSYSQKHKWINMPERLLAEAHSDKLQAQLTGRKLSLQHRKDEVTYFWLSDIVHIQIKDTRLMFPFIIGSLLSTLFLVSVIKGEMGQWFGTILFLVSLLMAYYGWQGTQILEVQTKSSLHRFVMGKKLNSEQEWTNLIIEVHKRSLLF
ncbi:MAG: hypothetical protein JJT94_04475 [Bernardetiaceae bacterium]|nr:hypothetical protein [Bernardetiaceae bacterium]